MFIYVNSEDSCDIHFSNNSTSFVLDINPPIQLNAEENWICALTECHIDGDYEQDLYIYCDLIDSSIVKGKRRNILRVVNRNETYSFPYYKPVVKNYVDQIRFRITTYDDSKVTLKLEKTRLVLDLIKH